MHNLHNGISKIFLTYTYHIITIIFRVNLMSPESLWRHKGVAMYGTHKTMHRFSEMYGSSPPTSELRLQTSGP